MISSVKNRTTIGQLATVKHGEFHLGSGETPCLVTFLSLGNRSCNYCQSLSVTLSPFLWIKALLQPDSFPPIATSIIPLFPVVPLKVFRFFHPYPSTSLGSLQDRLHQSLVSNYGIAGRQLDQRSSMIHFAQLISFSVGISAKPF